jgi:chitin disaccharide deacetylase
VNGQPPLPPGLIVNADDLGIHPSINAGIFSAYRHGILTSATMLMTTPYVEETIRQLRSEPLPHGIHLSLTLGRAMAKAGDVPDLIDRQGNLRWSARKLLLYPFTGESQRLLGQIRREFQAQLDLALDHGLRLTHADSHQHVHMNPAIYALVESLLPRYGIKRLRFSREKFSARSLPLLVRQGKTINLLKIALLRHVSRKIRPELVTTEEFFGVLFSGVVTKAALHKALLSVSDQNSWEICIHPGFPVDRTDNPYPIASANDFIRSGARQMEHDVLTDFEIQEVLGQRGLVLRDFTGEEKRRSRFSS